MRGSLLVWIGCGMVAVATTACGGSSHGDDDDDDGGASGASGEASGGSSASSNGGSSGSSSANGGSSATGNGGTTSGNGGTHSDGGTTSGNGGTTSGKGGSGTNGGTSTMGGTSSGGTGGTLGEVGDLPFLHVDGNRILAPNAAVVNLRGIAFGNDVWSEPVTPLTTHHAEVDFERIHDWGANVSRFYLNYQLFEDDLEPGAFKQAAFDYLDQNLQWAARYGVYLIFNIHVPEGGFQSNGDGDALWTDAKNQDRLVALWRAIADHCKGVGAVAGYDLLNEPRPTTSRDQWMTLATRIAEAIREVDADHMLVVERTNSVGDDWSNDGTMNFFRIPDENVLYEFHFYEPFEYTTQLAEWLDLGEGGKYPDETRISTANLTWYDWSYEPSPPPYAPPGDSPWLLYESDRYTIDDPEIKALGVALVSELNAGTVWFDDVYIDEYDADGVYLGRVFEQDLENMSGWAFWTAGTTGTSAVSSDDPHSGAASLSILNTDHDSNLASSFRYPVMQGHQYGVGGFMRGQAISDDSRPDPRGDWTQVSRALIRLDYFSADGELMARDKNALAASLDKFVAWGQAENVPLFIGEFGLIHYCFEDERGGTSWVSDMLELLDERGLHYTYHVYHEPAFGIFQSESSKLPELADANQPLIDVFQAHLRPAP